MAVDRLVLTSVLPVTDGSLALAGGCRQGVEIVDQRHVYAVALLAALREEASSELDEEGKPALHVKALDRAKLIKVRLSWGFRVERTVSRGLGGSSTVMVRDSAAMIGLTKASSADWLEEPVVLPMEESGDWMRWMTRAVENWEAVVSGRPLMPSSERP